MRIGIEAQRIFRKKKHGMDIYVLELIRQLQQIDPINEYFIFVKPGEDNSCLKETENFKIIEVKGLTYADWEQWSLPRAVKKYNLDLLHCTSNTAPLNCDVPTYITLHDIIYLNQSFSGGSLYQKLGHYYRKWIVPKVFKKAEKVFTVSEFEKVKINNHFESFNKVATVYNGVAPKFKILTETEITAVKSRLNLPEKYLFFLGNTAPKKNMKGMLEAYSIYLKETHEPLPLVVAESSLEDIKTMLYQIGERDLSILDHIHLTGYLKHDWLPVVYATAEAFIYPSLRESFGIPIIEAMACGTPVVTSNTSSMPEVAGECALLIDPENPMDISMKIQAITQIPQFRKEMIRRGLKRASQFTWEKTAKSTLASYTRTVPVPAVKAA